MQLFLKMNKEVRRQPSRSLKPSSCSHPVASIKRGTDALLRRRLTAYHILLSKSGMQHILGIKQEGSKGSKGTAGPTIWHHSWSQSCFTSVVLIYFNAKANQSTSVTEPGHLVILSDTSASPASSHHSAAVTEPINISEMFRFLWTEQRMQDCKKDVALTYILYVLRAVQAYCQTLKLKVFSAP